MYIAIYCTVVQILFPGANGKNCTASTKVYNKIGNGIMA
jgi:hypothetical protein